MHVNYPLPKETKPRGLLGGPQGLAPCVRIPSIISQARSMDYIHSGAGTHFKHTHTHTHTEARTHFGDLTEVEALIVAVSQYQGQDPEQTEKEKRVGWRSEQQRGRENICRVITTDVVISNVYQNDRRML